MNPDPTGRIFLVLQVKMYAFIAVRLSSAAFPLFLYSADVNPVSVLLILDSCAYCEGMFGCISFAQSD